MKYFALVLMGVVAMNGIDPSQVAQEDHGDRGLPTAKPPRKPSRRVVSDTAKYKVELKSTDERRWVAVRYNVESGESWRMMEGRWLPIREMRQLRPRKRSEFVVEIDHIGADRYCALRMDVRSGQCWALEEGTWTPILEEDD